MKSIETQLQFLIYDKDKTPHRYAMEVTNEQAKEITYFFSKADPENEGAYKKDDIYIWVVGSLSKEESLKNEEKFY